MRIFYIIFFVFISNLSWSQSSLKKAEHHFKNMDFNNVIASYNKAIEDKVELSQSQIEQLADSYFNINDYQNAKLWYDKLYASKQNSMSEVSFSRYLSCLRSNRDYEPSLYLLKEYYKNDPKKINFYAARKKQFDSIFDTKNTEFVRNLVINTKYSEFGTVKYNEKFIFSSSRDSLNFNSKLYKWNNQPYLNLFVSEVNLSNGELSQVQLLLKDIKSNYHTGTVAFSPDYKYVFFTRNYIKKNQKLSVNQKGMSNLQIVRGTLENGKVINEEILKFNSDTYSCGQPAISDDGKYLFFVSDMPGTKGQTDIYVAEIFDDGTINTPVNVGDQINTAGREMFPYFKNGTLYFASDNHYGFGGLDIFKSEMKSKVMYVTPKNLGKDINSNMDDFAITFNENNLSGYFSSNRSGGKGDDDIYYFELQPIIKNQTLSGVVYEEKSKLPIPNASVKVYNLFDEVIQEQTSDDKGNYTLSLPCSSEYVVEFSKSGYSTKKINYVADEVPNKVTKQDVYLTKFSDLVKEEDGVVKIIVEPIYFDYNKWDITPKAVVELEKVLKVMREFPDVKIKIESHTDARGKDAYNLSLSDKRAKSTQAYLIESGIDMNRIESAIGYGESRLKNHCEDGVKCSEELHSINRRSDFIILSNKQ